MANRDTILAYIDAPIVRLGDGDPALIVPALAAAATLLTVVGAVGLLAGRDPIAARLDTGVSGAGRAGAARSRWRQPRSSWGPDRRAGRTRTT